MRELRAAVLTRQQAEAEVLSIASERSCAPRRPSATSLSGWT